MKNNMRAATNSLSGLNFLRQETRSGACKGYSGMWFVVLLLAVLIGGCGSSGSSGGNSAPTVSSTVPDDLAEGVAIDANITAIFNNTMDPATITTTTFTLTDPALTLVEGEVSLSADGLTAIFMPKNNLAAETTFAATLTTEIKDLHGKALKADKIWSFKTGTTLSPTVLSRFPDNGAFNVPLDTTISVVFSVAMDPSTVDTKTFTVAAGNNLKSVKGEVSLSADGKTATFTPTEGLAPDTQYLVTVTTGVKDLTLAGNPMKESQVWVFVTVL